MNDTINRAAVINSIDYAIANKMRLMELALQAGSREMADRHRLETQTLREIRARIEAMA